MAYLHIPPSEKLQKEAEGGSGEQRKYLEEVKELEGILPDIDSKVRYHRLYFSVKGTHYILKHMAHIHADLSKVLYTNSCIQKWTINDIPFSTLLLSLRPHLAHTPCQPAVTQAGGLSQCLQYMLTAA